MWAARGYAGGPWGERSQNRIRPATLCALPAAGSRVNVEQVDLDDRGQVRRFLQLPFQVNRGSAFWTPPLARDASRQLDRRKNPFFRDSEAAFFLATDGSGHDVGRIAVLDHRRYNEHNGERTALFFLFDCEDDAVAARSLFAAAGEWARSRGLHAIMGPRGFSAVDPLGLLVEGFEHPPAFGVPYNLEYYGPLVEACGLAPAGDILSGYLDRSMQFPDIIREVADRARKQDGFELARLRGRGDLRRLLPGLKRMYNGTIEGTHGNYPLTDEEVDAICSQMLWFADLRVLKILLKDEEPIGFLFAYPDVSAALRRTGGKLLPLGWARLLRERSRTPWINLNGLGIVARHRGLGAAAILFTGMYDSIMATRYQFADLVQIGDENERVLQMARGAGVAFYKRHRLYRKDL